MKKTAIIYASKYGTTEKVASLLAGKLGDDTVLISLKQNKNPDINPFTTIILGTSIYAGKPQKIISKFCEKNKEALTQKTIGLFICGMQPDEENKEAEIIAAYPEYLRLQAKAKAFLGGEFIFEKLNFFEKFIIKRISRITNSVSEIDYEAIEKFAEKIKQI